MIDSWKTIVALALWWAAAGCAARPPLLRDATDCARIEVFPAGTAPARPFRVIGPLEARWDVTASGRYHTLQQKACELGADAVIGATESTVGGGMAMGTLAGNHLMMMGSGGHVVASAVAIVYTDRLVLMQDASGPPIVVPGGAP